jgi:hypothetical protein
MYENTEDLDRLKTSSLVLTVIFSQGEHNIQCHVTDFPRTNPLLQAVLPTGRKLSRRAQKGPSKKVRGRNNQMPKLGKIFEEWAEKGPNFLTVLWPLRFLLELLKNWNFDRH